MMSSIPREFITTFMEVNMGLLKGKKALIFGLANHRSVAWGIAQAMHKHGATIGLSYAGKKLERRAKPLAESIGCTFLEECDVSSDESIQNIADKAANEFGEVDILVHSIAFANREELTGPYYNTSREGFHLALDISAYSLVALARAFQPIMPRGGSMVCMSYYGGIKVAPHYNVMGVAKAALESSARYLAYDLGPQGIRVNAISFGPIRTLAAAGVSGFKDMMREFANLSPMGENITVEDVSNAAVFLCSDMAAHTTGDIFYVDSGYNIMGVASPEDKTG
jgi:enoyl-[acyl-carrier protein] reductase I